MLRTKTVCADKRFSVTAVESLEFRTDRANHGRFTTGSLKPIVIIVRETNRTYAFDMDAQPVDIDGLNLLAGFDLAVASAAVALGNENTVDLAGSDHRDIRLNLGTEAG